MRNNGKRSFPIMSSIIPLLVESAEIAIFNMRITFALKYISSLFDSYANRGKFIDNECSAIIPPACFLLFIDLLIPDKLKLVFSLLFIAIYPPFFITGIILFNKSLSDFFKSTAMIKPTFGITVDFMYSLYDYSIALLIFVIFLSSFL